MKYNELEVYKALKVLKESGYLVNSAVLNENRTFDVEDLVSSYKKRIMTFLRQKITQLVDKVYDGEDVGKKFTIEIPHIMVPVTYRKEPVKMKALTVNFYFDRKEVKKDYDKMKGKGEGEVYALQGFGDTNPGLDGKLDPVVMMYNIPQMLVQEKSQAAAKGTKKATKIAEATGSNDIPFPDARERLNALYRGNVDLSQIRPKKKTTTASQATSRPTTGYTRTAERDALYARFANRYSSASSNAYSSYTPSRYSNPYSYLYEDNFDFKAAVEQAEADATSPAQVVDRIMEKYFGSFFQEVLQHELTHFIQANNMELDGTENVKDYVATQVLSRNEYGAHEAEYEAKLHQHLPLYIGAIHKAKNITTIAKKIVTSLFAGQFKSLTKQKQQRYFNEILTLCQVIKSHPEITRFNYNTPKIKKLLRDSL